MYKVGTAFLLFVSVLELEGVRRSGLWKLFIVGHTFIIKNLYSDLSEVFDTIIENKNREEIKVVTEM